MPSVRSQKSIQAYYSRHVNIYLPIYRQCKVNRLIRILDINSRLLIYVTSITKLTFLKENSIHNIPEMKFGHVTLDHRRQKITVACIVPISSSEACLRKSFFPLQSRSQFSYSYSSVNLLIFSFGYLLTACLFNMSSKADR